MQKRMVDLAVGIFFLLGIAAFVVLALQVSGLKDIYHKEEGYSLLAEFVNVGGLKPRAKVTIAGVEVGRVVSIKMDPKTHYALVKMQIEEDVNNIPDDSDARILTAGLLGDNYVGLEPGQSTTVYKPGDVIPVENTYEAIVIEKLIDKFVAQKATNMN